MQTYRILIIDDDALHREVLREYLTLSGLEAFEAEDGQVGLERAREMTPDLVLLDVQMPQMDGFATLEALQADPALAPVPVLFLTSHDRPNLKVRGLELGADDYIVKPFHRAELLARVKAALRRSRRYRDRIGQLQGSLSTLDLFELVSTLEISQKNAQIELPELAATIDLGGGRFEDARFEGFTGADALFRIFLAAHGAFQVQFRPAGAEAAPHREGIGALLLEAARQLDEWTQDLPGLPSLTAWLEAGPGVVERLPESIASRLPMPASLLLARLPQAPAEGARQLRAWLADGTLRVLDPS